MQAPNSSCIATAGNLHLLYKDYDPTLNPQFTSLPSISNVFRQGEAADSLATAVAAMASAASNAANDGRKSLVETTLLVLRQVMQKLESGEEL
jgi:hypothetical protein